MPGIRGLRWLVAAVVVPLGLAMGIPGASALSVPDPAGTVVLPLQPSSVTMSPYILRARGDSLAYGAYGAGFVYRRSGSTTDVWHAGQLLDVVGSALTYSFDGTVHRLDVATGSDTDTGVGMSPPGRWYRGNTGDGILVQVGSQLVKQVAGKPDQPLVTLPSGVTIAGVAAVDSRGFVYAVGTGTTPSTAVITAHYVDFATVTDRVVTQTSGTSFQATLSPSDIVWVIGTLVGSTFHRTIYRTSRAGGGAVVEHAAGPQVWQLAATDSLTGYQGDAGIRVFPAAGGADLVVTAPTNAPLTSSGAQLLVVGETPAPGVYAVAADATLSLVAPLARKPAFSRVVALTAGRLVYNDDRAGSTEFRYATYPVWARSATPASSGAAVGPEARVATGDLAAASGDRVAIREPTRITVVGGRNALTWVPPSGGGVRLSGPRLLSFAMPFEPNMDVSPEPDLAATGLLVDLTTGGRMTVPPNSSVWGPYLVYATHDGAVWRRDLTRAPGATNPLRVSPTLPVCARLELDGPYPTGRDCVVSTEVWGDWVGWRARTGSRGTYLTSLKNVRTGLVVHPPDAVPEDTIGGLTDGSYLARTSDGSHGMALSAVDLRHPTAPATRLPTTTAPLDHASSSMYAAAAVDERLVAWIGLDSRTKVATLPYDATTAPRLLYGSQATVSKVWNGEFDTTKPLAGWRVELRRAWDGKLVRTFTGGAAPYGVVRVSWNGRNSAGTPQPSGVYTWWFTGTAADGSGSVRAADGISAARGRFGFSVTPLAVVNPLPVSSSRSTGLPFPVSWRLSAPAKVKSYQLSWQASPPSGPLTAKGLAHRWLTTTTTSATFGRGGRPTAVTPGRTYYFSACMTDRAGRTGMWSNPVAITVPYDDRSPQVRHSTGWSALTRLAGRFLGSIHQTRLAGKTMSVTTTGREVWIVGDKGPSDGSFTATVDGVPYTASTYRKTTAHRAVLFHLVLQPWATTKAHTIRITTSGTRGHPWIRIDAIGILR